MKTFLLIFFCLISIKAFSKDLYSCSFKKFDFQFSLANRELINIEMFKSKTKVMSCLYKVDSYENKDYTVTGMATYRIKLNNCNIIYDRESQKISFIDKGFIKEDSKRSKLYAYIIKNEQPLLCSLK